MKALSSSYYVSDAADEENCAKWRKSVAAETLRKLSEAKLAKVLCLQFQNRITLAHEAFQSSLKIIEEYHTGRSVLVTLLLRVLIPLKRSLIMLRLRKAEEQRLALRKQHAPRLAKLAMESLALRDSLLYGMCNNKKQRPRKDFLSFGGSLRMGWLV